MNKYTIGLTQRVERMTTVIIEAASREDAVKHALDETAMSNSNWDVEDAEPAVIYFCEEQVCGRPFWAMYGFQSEQDAIDQGVVFGPCG